MRKLWVHAFVSGVALFAGLWIGMALSSETVIQSALATAPVTLLLAVTWAIMVVFGLFLGGFCGVIVFADIVRKQDEALKRTIEAIKVIKNGLTREMAVMVDDGTASRI